MSWFKSTTGEATSMTNYNFDKRPARNSIPDPKPAEAEFHAPPPRGEPKAPPEAKAAAEHKPATSVFGPTLRFKGELRAEEDFVLQGRIEGSIHHTQNFTIGTDGVVKGDSRARTIIVEGTVEGDLYALESIHIRPTAKVHGNLMAPRVAIADGASFNGKVDMATAARAARSIADRQASMDDTVVDQMLTTGTSSE
jgi:cytoskeletal protein CcmA (bactofilin family)